jgi:CSLREA domain-containing protein
MNAVHPQSLRTRAPSLAPLALALAAALGMTVLPGLAQATIYTVTSGGDSGDGTCAATCTLRDAVTAANANSGADTITFASTVSGDTVTLDIAGKDHIVITDNLTIQGPGANLLTVSGGNVASSHKGGILEFTAGSLTVSGITLADGNTSDRGGALSFDYYGQLALSGVAIQDSHAQSFGGGVYKDSGTLTVTRCTISGNSAGGSGGGFASNYATATIVDSTISGNSAGGFGGGFYVRAGLTINNSTINGNSASSGGGFFITKFDGVLTNSIVANNTASGGAEFDGATQASVSSNITANYSLIKGSYTVSGTFSGSNNVLGQDPNLGPLADNGGPTQTLALLPGSPAIDAGSNGTCASNDQRGVTRPVDGNLNGTATCDMGAFELIADRIFYNGFD